MAKPFVKWAGGKGKLLPTLEANLPLDFNKQQEVTYIEPFVGGGAMLFYMLEKYPNLLNLQKNDKDGFLLDVYVNAIRIDSHFACKLGDCIVKNGEGTVWFPKFLSVANAFGRIGNTTLSELAALRRRYPLC